MIKIGTIIMALLLAGCASSPQSIPFSNQNSDALNIANQTDLVKNSSRLRDFSVEEIEATKTNLESNVGSASKTIGAFKILTGDWMGALDVAGGSVASLSMEGHTASHYRWIIAVNTEDHLNSLAAKKDIKELINRESKSILQEKGNAFNRVPYGFSLYDSAQFVQTINDFSRVSFGYYENEQIDNQDTLKIGVSNLIDAKNQYLALDNNAKIHDGAINPAPFILNYVKGYEGEEGYDQYLKDLTARLPEGYYLYVPSYMNSSLVFLNDGEKWGCDISKCATRRYYRTHKSVPSIYTQGRRLDFIKPTQS